MAYRGTKFEILAAAEDLISRKGVQESTISEIAASAGVTDSVIYHYFQNKEDLVFSITGLHMEDVNNRLQEHLEGILEPISLLSKMCWFHLHYNLTHKYYSRILLFECRSNRNFYKHESYQLIRRYAGIMLSILNEGVERGVFREDLNMRLVRDIILGGLDWETLMHLSLRDQARIAPSIREIMDLVCNMIEIRHAPTENDLDKPTRITTAAERLFSAKGFGQTSIAEIARSSEVAEGTVYEYFENKQDLLFSIPRMRFKEHLESLTEVFEIKTTLRKLRRFIRYHFFLYMTEPDFLRTFLLDIQLNPKYYDSEAFSFFEEYARVVDGILEQGIGDGSMRPTVNAPAFKCLLFGGFCHIALRWLILEQEGKFDKMDEVNEMVSLMTTSVSTE
jgi:TetR/AcrR family fatty acid metabolism transcriptional regulator